MKFQIVIALALSGSAAGCSNLLITPGATVDGSAMISYNADSGTLYGSLYHYPAGTHAEGEMRQIYDWDSGKYLGEIPEVSTTYNVVGNINEWGLSIGETTFGGVDFGEQSDAVLDYGSLIWVTLQRAKTAREAIQVLGDLMATYGYASEGESFSVADAKEVWLMEIVGKGSIALGAVWVAVRVPDGYVSAHANQARITTFDWNDSDQAMYASDVASFAVAQGLYPSDASKEDFSFSDVYDAVTFEGARFCEARVWSFFGNVTSTEWAQEYLDYASGYNLTNRMPLWVQPSEKLSVAAVEHHMRNTYQGTPLTMMQDVGSGGYASGQRAHPLTWTSQDSTYINERPIGTQQTGWNFVAQLRASSPYPLQGVLWFGVDDSSTTARFPVYGCSTYAPRGWAGKGAQDGVTPPMMTFDMSQAFTVFNLVANLAYSRWRDASPLVVSAAQSSTANFQTSLAATDANLTSGNYTTAERVALATTFSAACGTKLLQAWTQLFGDLFVQLRDGYTITADANDAACGCSVGSTGYEPSWYDRIAEDTGDHLLVPDSAAAKKGMASGTDASVKFKPKSKLALKALQ